MRTIHGSNGDDLLTPGITKAGTGIDGIVWNILGQTYVPKQLSARTHFPGTPLFRPAPSCRPTSIRPRTNSSTCSTAGSTSCSTGASIVATTGDLIRLPMNMAHGIFNKTDQTVKCFFWVTPTRKLYDLFWAIHGMKEQSPPDVVALSAKHEVMFLPPPEYC